jgi:hypothetical protein
MKSTPTLIPRIALSAFFLTALACSLPFFGDSVDESKMLETAVQLTLDFQSAHPPDAGLNPADSNAPLATQPGGLTPSSGVDLVVKQALVRFDGMTGLATFEATVCNIGAVEAGPFEVVISANGVDTHVAYPSTLASFFCVGVYDANTTLASYGVYSPGNVFVTMRVLPGDAGEAEANNVLESYVQVDKLDTHPPSNDLALYQDCLTRDEHRNCSQSIPRDPVANPHEIKKQAGNYMVIVPAAYEALANYQLIDNQICATALESYLGISIPQPVVERGVISDYSGGYAGSQGGIFTSGPASTFDLYLSNLADSWRYALNGQCVNAHELTHLFLGDVPMPSWLNEGLATIAQTTARTNYYNDLNIECREAGWYGTDYYGTLQEVPYQNLMVYDTNVPGIYYYYTGMCFWDYIESTYGTQAVQHIIQATVAYRDPVYNGCTPETLSTYFIQDIVNPVLGTDISPVTQARWGFGPTYTGCE